MSKPQGSPLWKHPNGQWCKKIKNKVHYFGSNYDTAITSFFREAPTLMNGQALAVDTDAWTVGDVCAKWLGVKRAAVDSGDLKARSYQQYKDTVNVILGFFKPDRAAAQLGPDDFRGLMDSVVNRWGPTKRGHLVTQTRMIFKWAVETELLTKPIRYGPDFKKPSLSILRRHRAKNPMNILAPQEIHDMLAKATPPLKAMILLGINGGFGNTDCAELPMDRVDLSQGVIDWPRPKTGIERVVPLWDETADALNEYLARRPSPQQGAEHLVFVTKYGRPWVREAIGTDDEYYLTDSVITEYDKLRRSCLSEPTDKGFYSFRRTFRTIADGARNQRAVDRIMGHLTPGMGTRYVQRIEINRLRVIANHVLDWLYG